MAKKLQTRPILWCFDPFSTELTFHEHALKVLLPIAKALNCKIQPVAFIDAYRSAPDASHRWPIFPEDAETFDALITTAKAKTKALYQKRRAQLLPPTFLTHPIAEVPTLTEKILAIDVEAIRCGAIFVALHTHSRKGFQRFFMGSFAETFMLYGRTPCLLINPHVEIRRTLKRILFPTDLSSQSISALSRLKPIIKGASVEISLVNFSQKSVKNDPWLTARATKQINNELEQRAMRKLRDGNALAKRHSSKDTRVEFELRCNDRSIDPSEGIVKMAEAESFDLIALAAQSSPLSVRLLGATTRSVVRASERAVLILRE